MDQAYVTQQRQSAGRRLDRLCQDDAAHPGRRSPSITCATVREQTTSPSHQRRLLGRLGEDIAARYLADQGWMILERNWRSQRYVRGELDIVAAEPRKNGKPALVVVEVKTRRTVMAGMPAESITASKAQRLARLAAAWASSHPQPHGPLRIDVISILLRPHEPAQLRHHRAVLGGEE